MQCCCFLFFNLVFESVSLCVSMSAMAAPVTPVTSLLPKDPPAPPAFPPAQRQGWLLRLSHPLHTRLTWFTVYLLEVNCRVKKKIINFISFVVNKMIQ